MLRILVPRFGDAQNLNAQNLNVRGMLPRFEDKSIRWVVPHIETPDPILLGRENIELVSLWKGRSWRAAMTKFYQRPADAIFYPVPESPDVWGLKLRKWSGRAMPLIATLEGLAGDEAREKELSQIAGHPVYCHRVSAEVLARVDFILREADHVIAISPFLARMGKHLYGPKFSVLPLGVDERFFRERPPRSGPFRVVNAATFQERKRPELFLELAKRFPSVEFVWFGDGPRREHLLTRTREAGLKNLSFPGSIGRDRIAEELRNSDTLVIPSTSEGVPKISQEAAACGLPIILFGFYEAPTVVDGENGFVVWEVSELIEHVGQLAGSPELATRMSKRSLQFAKDWSWDLVARRWEAELRSRLS